MWKGKYNEVEGKLPLLAQVEGECKGLREKLVVEGVNNSKL